MWKEPPQSGLTSRLQEDKTSDASLAFARWPTFTWVYPDTTFYWPAERNPNKPALSKSPNEQLEQALETH